jgi:hypothetical protein
VSAPPLPAPVAELAAQLSRLPGVVAVALGGSRAAGTARPDSDWDLGLYYRSAQKRLDPHALRRLGHPGYVSELGEWGPIVNGGAWLTVDGTAVDVLFRDLDLIDEWRVRAERGDFDILRQEGHLAGAPTYLPVGELALGHPIEGELPRPEFPDALLDSAPSRWEGQARVSLLFATGYARTGDVAPCLGMLARAALSVAHARLVRRREWVLNEKALLARAGLNEVHALLQQLETSTVDAVAAALELEPLRPR